MYSEMNCISFIIWKYYCESVYIFVNFVICMTREKRDTFSKGNIDY